MLWDCTFATAENKSIHSVTKKEIQEVVARFNIQVNNLTQVLNHFIDLQHLNVSLSMYVNSVNYLTFFYVDVSSVLI